MTDKVQKIRQEIEKRLKCLEEIKLRRELAAAEIGDIACCKYLLSFIDFLQKEPETKFKIGDRIRLKGTTVKGDVIKNIYNAEDGGVYFEFENSDDAPADCDWELVEEPKKCMYTKDDFTEEDRKILCEDCEEECEYAKKEEPVSDDEIEKKFKVGDVVVYVSRQPAYSGLYLLGNPNDLSIGYSNANEPYQIALRNCTVASEDERKQFMRELESNGYKWNEDTLRIEKEEPASEDFEDAANNALERMLDKYGLVGTGSCLEMFKLGAEWQKTKDESCSKDLGEYINKLSKQFPEVSFAKLSRIAVRVAKWQKDKMMAKAINTEASLTMSVPSICISLPLGVNVGDKVKVIVIKED